MENLIGEIGTFEGVKAWPEPLFVQLIVSKRILHTENGEVILPKSQQDLLVSVYSIQSSPRSKLALRVS